MTQTTDSNPRPMYTFQVNLETVNRTGSALPNRTSTMGNETVSEANEQKYQRTIFLPNVTGGGFVYRHQTFPADKAAGQGYYHHGDQVVAYGKAGMYLKNTYTSTPPAIDDVLILVSITP